MCVNPTVSRSTGLKTYVYSRGFRGSTERPSYSFTVFKDLIIGNLHCVEDMRKCNYARLRKYSLSWVNCDMLVPQVCELTRALRIPFTDTITYFRFCDDRFSMKECSLGTPFPEVNVEQLDSCILLPLSIIYSYVSSPETSNCENGFVFMIVRVAITEGELLTIGSWLAQVSTSSCIYSRENEAIDLPAPSSLPRYLGYERVPGLFFMSSSIDFTWMKQKSWHSCLLVALQRSNLLWDSRELQLPGGRELQYFQ